MRWRSRPGPVHRCVIGSAAAGLFVLAWEGTLQAEMRWIDVERSSVTVQVAASGGGFTADAHLLIDAPLTEGSVEDTDTPHLALVIDVGRLRVVDPERSGAERETMRARLIGPDGLDAERFSRITYHSLAIDQPKAGVWLVRGELEMYGRFLPLDVRAVRHGDRFTGTTTLSPAEFGLSPMRMAGVPEPVGVEVRVDFDIVLEAR